jgi:hypothetical protein
MMTKLPARARATLPLFLVAGASAVYAQSASEDRPVASFSKLIVGNGIDVYLTQSTEESLRVEVEDYDLADVLSAVEGDVLQLSIKNKGFAFFDDREAKVYLNFVDLSAIEASGGSDIEGRNDLELDTLSVQASGGSDVELAVNAQSLEFVVSGGSDVEVSGATKSLAVTASGGSDISARSLQAERVKATVAGGSDAALSVSTALDLDASSGSDVVIYGNPAEKTVNNDRSSDVVWR